MIITYHGGSCFRLQNGDLSALIDPENNRLKADITLFTSTSAETPPSEKEVIAFGGEYEAHGIEIEGWQGLKDSDAKNVMTAYAIQWDDIRILALGGLAHAPEELLDRAGEVDVLLVRVGKGGMDEKDAATLVKKIEPSVVIPAFDKTPSDLLKSLGQKASLEEKFVFKKKDLSPEAQKVVLLEAK